MNMQKRKIFLVKMLLEKLKEMNIEVSNHMSTIRWGDNCKLDSLFK